MSLPSVVVTEEGAGLLDNSTTGSSSAEESDFQAFESGCYDPPQGFHHRQHVRMAWIYLRRLPLLEALERFSEGIRRFARLKGVPGLYHETITWAYLFLINERLRDGGAALEWAEFARLNPDLLRWKGGLLEQLYSRQHLFSEKARRVFVLPDKTS